MTTTPRWNLAQRLGFRFAFSYFALYFVTNGPVGWIPFSEPVIRKYVDFWYIIVVWVGEDLLHYKGEIYLLPEGTDGITNTAFGSILFLCYLATAVLVTIIWSVLDRKRESYTQLHQWFRLALRFMLALAMIRYGALKVIPTQMIAPPPLGLLTQRLGDLTRMRLLWLFMGASPAYETFTGCAELLGGVLLLFRRTTLLGALLSAANMTMVFTLNMCYDVHVKLYSFHLLTMAVLLVAPDLGRLANVLVLNRRTEPAEAPPLFANKWLSRAPHLLIFMVGLYLIGSDFQDAWARYQEWHPPQPPFYGVWSVETFTVDGEDVPRFTDPKGWRSMLFQSPGSVSIEHQIGSREACTLALNLKARRMILGRKDDEDWRATFTFDQPEADVLILDGQLDGHPTHIVLRRMALLRKGRWVFDPGYVS